MPRYDPRRIEPKWQKYWVELKTFRTPPEHARGEKLYVLDMFPYPSGAGLHVGHPLGYFATDIYCRYQRMRGRKVLHPMGWDAFGLPAEQYAIQTGTHPRDTTYKNIATYRRQLQMLGMSYDWDRELATTDPDYFRWTQWIFLVLFDTWYDPEFEWPVRSDRLGTAERSEVVAAGAAEAGQYERERQKGKGRPIAELPIPDDVSAQGVEAVRRYQDKHRLAYQFEAPVNWCPALGTVLANEEVIGGRSERGGHPVYRIPLRQWMLRITAYAERLLADLDLVDWPEAIKLLQRNWIGRSEGAEVDFYIGATGEGRGAREGGTGVRGEGSGQASAAPLQPSGTGVSPSGTGVSPVASPGTAGQASRATHTGAPTPHGPHSRDYDAWRHDRTESGFPPDPADDVLRIYTTRPDTLFGATYMVIAPEHPFVERLTTAENREAVRAYCRRAATKSDLDRTELAREKTGVPTGSFAINPVNDERIPIWVADYVLISYGTGAIMAVPAHDERDFEFARQFGLPIRPVVKPPDNAPAEGGTAGLPSSAGAAAAAVLAGRACFSGDGTAINSGPYDGLATPEFKKRITADLAAHGVGRAAVNYRLRDWLFSRQHFWGEPFPILHELDEHGQPTGLMRTVRSECLPVPLPEMREFKPHGRPEPPLEAAPREWLYVDANDPTVAPLQAPNPTGCNPWGFGADREPGVAGAKRSDAQAAGPSGGAVGSAPATQARICLKRETNTMPQWAGSCWYYLRFIDPKNDRALVDPAKERYWMPVDLYVGGAEHAVLHLLYARFWHKVLYDRGHVSTPEPFQRLVNQGMILGEKELTGYRTADGRWVSAERVVDEGEQSVEKDTGSVVEALRLSAEQVVKKSDGYYLKEDESVRVESRAFKMSKSRGNVINPDAIVESYGTDTLRLYEMFMGPLQDTKEWNTSDIAGVHRFLNRVWRMIVDERAESSTSSSGTGVPPVAGRTDSGTGVPPVAGQTDSGTGVPPVAPPLHPAVTDAAPSDDELRVLHRTIRAVSEDLDQLAFNTAISRMMEFVNFFASREPRPRACMEPFVLLLSPFAPHLAEECWQTLGHAGTLAYEPWPRWDEKYLKQDTLELPVQINGKLRSKITVAAEADRAAVEQAALDDPKVQAQLNGKKVVKVIVVPGKLVNVVVK